MKKVVLVIITVLLCCCKNEGNRGLFEDESKIIHNNSHCDKIKGICVIHDSLSIYPGNYFCGECFTVEEKDFLINICKKKYQDYARGVEFSDMYNIVLANFENPPSTIDSFLIVIKSSPKAALNIYDYIHETDQWNERLKYLLSIDRNNFKQYLISSYPYYLNTAK